MEKILVVEDEAKIRKIIISYLKEDYQITEAVDGREALEYFKQTDFDLIILDLMLPKISGEKVCQKIRQISEIPIIMLTAKSSEENKIDGFNYGTDDYITKPFSTKELVMRVKALLKRSGKLSQNEVIEVSGISIDKSSRTLSINSTPVSLSPKEFDILLYMIDNRNHALTRMQLLDRIWGYEYDGDTRVLDTTIKRLRKKLGSSGKLIKTLRGTGYMFGEKG